MIFKRFRTTIIKKEAIKTIQIIENNIEEYDFSIRQAINACRDHIKGHEKVPASVAEFLAAIMVAKEQNVTDITYDNTIRQVNWTQHGQSGFKKIRLQLWRGQKSSTSNSYTSFNNSGKSSERPSSISKATTRHSSPGPSKAIQAPVYVDPEYIQRLTPFEQAIIENMKKSLDALARYGPGPASMPTTTMPVETKGGREGNRYYCVAYESPKPSTLPIPSWFIKEKARQSGVENDDCHIDPIGAELRTNSIPRQLDRRNSSLLRLGDLIMDNLNIANQVKLNNKVLHRQKVISSTTTRIQSHEKHSRYHNKSNNNTVSEQYNHSISVLLNISPLELHKRFNFSHLELED
ncbi:hypothetical protein EG329_000835 [Mollisiaceae sp. DMI_Dod_QoI]|nr:hypothetical protein EG329_000835 [Helotiales sp. DMI_Dod_QoI]